MELDQLKILVVEDNLHFRNLVRTILDAVGILGIEEARDGAEAIEVLRSFPADVAILDWKMDGVDGVECARRIRTNEDSPNRFLPLIMVTGYTEASLIHQAYEAGVNDFLAKPISAKSLLSRISAVIEHPRPFIHTADFFGPDRRREQASFKGRERRLKQSNQVSVKNNEARISEPAG